MSKLSLLDLAFFLTETTESPKHVGGLLIFKRPDKSADNFVKELYDQCLQVNEATAPFNQITKLSTISIPEWKTDPGFDISNHLVFHSNQEAISIPQVNAFIAELHEPVLKNDKPLWELHFVDNVEGNRFVMYLKLHHAYADGMTMSRWLTSMLSEDQNDPVFKVFWNNRNRRKKSVRDQALLPKMSLVKLLKQVTGQTLSYYQTARGLAKVSLQLSLQKLNIINDAFAYPFSAARHTPLSGQVTAGRQIVTARVSLDRVAKIRKQTRCSLNHVALTCIDNAIHGYLKKCGIEFDDSVHISMPVSLRSESDAAKGNKVGVVLVDLAPKTDDIYIRLREIGFALRNIRYHVDDIPASSIMAYTLLLATVGQVAELLNLSNIVNPMGHTLVSNVPGPENTLYFKGAELEQMFPISTLPPGNRLNITLYSYDKYLYFGLVATKELEQLDSLGTMIEQSFEELERSIFTHL